MSDLKEDKSEEIDARMNAALKRALNTPPKPHKGKSTVSFDHQKRPEKGQGRDPKENCLDQ